MRITVISPFVDRQHGTERVLAEQLRRLTALYGCEVCLYSQQVRDLESAPNHVQWRKVPRIPGPYLLRYVFWFFANSICRWWDRRVRGLKSDLLFSPGINALDADAIAVHIVFHDFWRHAADQLRFRGSPPASWLRRLHRRLYYQCIMALERRVYADQKVRLTAVSELVARQLREHFGRTDVQVIPNAVETGQFNRTARLLRRQAARAELELDPEAFVLLLLGNDWVKKGLHCALHSIHRLPDLPIKLLVAGSDTREIFQSEIRLLGLQNRVKFERPSSDVMLFYAAADVYLAPSLEDAYGLPIIEAMACGLPVVASVRAGASEAIEHRKNGLLLQDPKDQSELSGYVAELFADDSLRLRLGQAAEITAREYTWERNAEMLLCFLHQAATPSRT
jgi:glycosyltransferase involved in cell wall biosynthesis